MATVGRKSKSKRLVTRTRSLNRLTLAAIMVIVVVAAGYLVVHLTHAATALQTVLPPAHGVYWGEAVTGGKLSTFQSRETLVGRKMDSWHFFQNFPDTLPTADMKTAESTGHIVLMNWKPVGYTWQQVANGNADSYIKQQADNIKAWGKPVILNFHHEPENDTANFGSPADFVAAFDHTVTVFRAEGADNVSWAWIMMAGTFKKDINSWYPGDNYVDWVGADVYSLWEISNHKAWVTVQNGGDDVYNWTTQTKAGAHNKPILYGEWATSEDDSMPNRKAQWITDALTTLKTWPQVKLVEYFDVNGSVITSSQAAVDAFTVDGNDPYTNQPHVFGTFGGTANTPTPLPTTAGDFNGDGKVNVTDLSALLSHWASSDVTTDLNHDGIVNVLDLSVLLSHWTG